MTRRIAELDVPLPDLLRQLHAASRCPVCKRPFENCTCTRTTRRKEAS
ncbi:hypothetical protein ACFZAO_05730 [Streptomyces griseoaurantiacus]